MFKQWVDASSFQYVAVPTHNTSTTARSLNLIVCRLSLSLILLHHSMTSVLSSILQKDLCATGMNTRKFGHIVDITIHLKWQLRAATPSSPL